MAIATKDAFVTLIQSLQMKIFRTDNGIVLEHHDEYFLPAENDWNRFVNRRNLFQHCVEAIKSVTPDPSLASAISGNLPAPIHLQEVWAAGVTYQRSREARMEEAKDAGAGDFYARVYDAARPELFFKSTASRVIGHGGVVRIRKDSNWNVPEPELTLFISSEATIEGYTIGNDMSSRDIEGENPLYLPQAKTYDASASIGPCIYVPEKPIAPDTMVRVRIIRETLEVFTGQVSINRMKRGHTELVEYLFRETSFPFGVFLMTGTGVVPPDDFTLHTGDEIEITIDGIGTLMNTVGKGNNSF
jgi:2-dehydro-3-deoxy-D-arabinonate dehydratase